MTFQRASVLPDLYLMFLLLEHRLEVWSRNCAGLKAFRLLRRPVVRALLQDLISRVVRLQHALTHVFADFRLPASDHHRSLLAIEV